MLEEHLEYVDDRTRLEQFREAFACVIRPGDRVADVGCGSGVLGLMCLQAGATRVRAIETILMIEVARETLARAIVLGSCDGQRSIQEIEQAVLRDYPDLFPSPEEISRFVSHVLGRDTE